MILATLANMSKYAAVDTVAYSPQTDETYSAHAGDYFMMTPEDYLRDSKGFAMVLARRIPEHFEPLENPA